MSTLTITAGPFLDRDGRWTVIARRGALIYRVADASKGEWFIPAPIERLVRALVTETGITPEEAEALLDTRERQAQ